MKRILLLLAASLLLPAPAAAQQPVLNVYNWTDHIDPAALPRFERESGVRVRYDVYEPGGCCRRW